MEGEGERSDLLDEERSAEAETRGIRPGSLNVGEQHRDNGWFHVLTEELGTLWGGGGVR